ncbi:hypothetical protein ZIOFF_055633 [Zingiber officinale]|uniref:DUF4283 domain-containing protein n=1 Tax=Zingiber officinale TaxID=94328 RepID=A0A8J5FGT7_ZINOF|nr:hypothetical protein ZIOFF_055633 [Zingiber officinale]
MESVPSKVSYAATLKPQSPRTSKKCFVDLGEECMPAMIYNNKPATADGTRLYMARVCVEIDLLKPKVEDFWIGIGEEKRLQKVVFEKHPTYCIDCLHLGHSVDDCYTNDKKPKPMWRSDKMETNADNEDLRMIINQRRNTGKEKENSADLKETHLDALNNKDVANQVWIQK